MLTRVSAALFATVVALVPTARAEIANGKVRIGVLTDLSGGYEQNSGNGSVEAAKMAAEEFGNKVNGAANRDPGRRSPEQARRRRFGGGAVVRRRQGRRDHRPR